MKHMEQEFKWEANAPRSFARMLRAASKILGGNKLDKPRKLHITDTYLDTATGALGKQKIALRVRCTDGKYEATYKTKTELRNGKAVRREETLPLPRAHSYAQALNALAAKKIWDGLALENLFALFVIKNKRTAYILRPDKQTSAELSLDDCRILSGGRTLLMKEIELEFKSGNEKSFALFARDLTRISGLIPARVSKVKTAASLQKIWEEK